MASYVNLDTIQRPSSGMVALSAWGRQVDDNFTVLGTKYQARRYLATTYAPAAAGWAAISLGGVSYDPYGCFTNAVNYTCPVAGYYRAVGAINWAAATARLVVGIGRNNVIVVQGNDQTINANFSGGTSVDLIKCNANDTLQLYGWCSIAPWPGISAGSPYTYFSVFLDTTI